MKERKKERNKEREKEMKTDQRNKNWREIKDLSLKMTIKLNQACAYFFHVETKKRQQKRKKNRKDRKKERKKERRSVKPGTGTLAC